jgi:hypothetical protein
MFQLLGKHAFWKEDPFISAIPNTPWFFMKQEGSPPTDYIYNKRKVVYTKYKRQTKRKIQSRNS